MVIKDIAVHSMLKDEIERCEPLPASFEAAIKELPKVSLHEFSFPVHHLVLHSHWRRGKLEERRWKPCSKVEASAAVEATGDALGEEARV